ncbi:MAG: AAA family ATPase [Erysipelotrichaceae bacterium]|nr:AAA family ATPase [Erysipelotrichaceae bacterium]
MLKRFEVKNFKNFKDMILDLSDTKGYEYNTYLIQDGIVKNGVIFGKNASGKSNLGLAIFDIVSNLTDNTNTLSTVEPYKNLDYNDENIEFDYTFQFNKDTVEYAYTKISAKELFYETLKINDHIVIQYNHGNKKGFCLLEGTENLNIQLKNNTLSFIKYINNNSVLKENTVNNVFKKFIDFVNNMLLFYSLEVNRYFGYMTGNDRVEDAIVRKGCLQDFEEFLHSIDINYHLISRKIDGKNKIFVKYQNGEAQFNSVASTGTRALALFYYWSISSDNVSFIYMDEFDAYYHFELANEVVKKILKKENTQIIFTSHNTNLMNNDLFRPDCLFIMQNEGIKSMSNLTSKELRKAHNLQKMYKAGAFDE